jgi:hypothetical protein
VGHNAPDRAVQQLRPLPEDGRSGQVHRLRGGHRFQGEELRQPGEHRQQPPRAERRVGRVVLDGVRAVAGIGAHRCGPEPDLRDEGLRGLGQRRES